MREKIMLISLLLVGGLLLISSCTSNDATSVGSEEEVTLVPITGDEEQDVDDDFSELEELDVMFSDLEELGLDDFNF